VVDRQAAGRPDRPRDVPGLRRRRPRQPGALIVQLARAVTDLVLVELESRAAERVGLDDLTAGVEISRVDAPHHVGVGVVPELGAGAVREPGGEQHRPVAAVEHERFAAADPLDDLPSTRPHGATSALTRALALTTASVESLAYPSAPISSAKAWLTGAPPTMTLTRSRSPALISASIVRFIAGMVVVNSAEIPTMFAWCSSTAATNTSGATSRPRFTTLNPAP